MEVTTDTEIMSSKEAVWDAITDIENSEAMISGVIKINILHQPAYDLVGLKWEETRRMFGKEAMETMWVTEASRNEYYSTRAESHGSIYITRLCLSESATGTLLTITFTSIAQSFGAKLISFLMGPMIKGSIKKALAKDLEDIKVYVERRK